MQQPQHDKQQPQHDKQQTQQDKQQPQQGKTSSQAGKVQIPPQSSSQSQQKSSSTTSVQPVPSTQPRDAKASDSKSFGESQTENLDTVSGQHASNESGMIPKENSFPVYKDDAPSAETEKADNYKH